MSSWSARVPTSGRWPGALVAAMLLVQVVAGVASTARADGLSPREVAITDAEVGRQAARTIDKEGDDGRASWVDLRWERDQDSPDARTGPATIENLVWIARDLGTARTIYQEQSAKNKDFPEAFYAHKGPYAFPISGIGDEVSAISACLDCNAKEELRLHHRVTFRRGVVVAVVYLYGAESTTPQSLASWFVAQAANRVPDAATRAPDSPGDQQSASAPSAGNVAQQPAPTRVAVIVAEPRDLAIKIGEAGTGAKVAKERDGIDARGSWYEVRYEREGSGSRFYQGPVVIHNVVFVARDGEGGSQTFQEQAALNERFPEAERRVGQKSELKDAGEVGEEAAGISACERSCNTPAETFVHKRLVSRVGNVVSVVYLWGLSHEDGTTDWHARYLGDLVVARARAAARAMPI